MVHAKNNSKSSIQDVEQQKLTKKTKYNLKKKILPVVLVSNCCIFVLAKFVLCMNN